MNQPLFCLTQKETYRMYQIFTDVPVPPFNSKVGGPIKYPFHIMEIGNSFFIPIEEGETAEGVSARAYVAISGYRKRTGDRAKRFTVRRDRRDHNRIGVWRVA
ncbi:DUF7303 family protein [Allosphingosinicella humi]